MDEDNKEDLEVVKTLDASKSFKSSGVVSLERIVPSKVLKHSIEKAPTLELKPLPNHFHYAYLNESDTLPVIISSSLSDVQKPSVESQRRLNPIMKEVVKKKIIKWLDAGIIYLISDSSWKGGITMVHNMHNELIPTKTVAGWTVCMDYIKLNKATRKDHFPLPFIDQMLDRLAGKMSFGLCNAPTIFQRCMMAIFTDMVENYLEVFIDDFSVYGDSFDECLNNLSKGIVLGYKVFNRGIKVDKVKLKTIEKLPPPTSVKGVCSFLGHAGFYYRFIKDFSKISKPLCNLLEKDVPFKFDDTCLHDFDELKGRLISTPIIIIFPFELICDASNFTIRTVLGQRKDKIFRSIYYASKTLNDAQLNYMTTEKELLAVVFAFDKFRSYLVGTKVIVYTDHSAIRYLIKKKDAKPRLIHWGDRTAANILQSDFYWPNVFKDAHSFVANCDRCQRTRNISRRHEMPLNTILEVELFDVWAIISDGVTHFCNQNFGALLSKYGIKYKIFTPSHPQTNGQVKVSNQEIKRILEKTVSSTPCHLLVELEHNAYWAIRKLTFDMPAVGEKRLLQLNELNEFRF
ncbi:DNA-directed DNA polymerase [Handroanthus impetiginosus]|uniref:DNA-directed DNA polymerase n=1 Tax=Handroanthus impetiginosus TaxID=429701 RepID=A0A2G9GFS6_9LAMI|nr:DNA-directed DNA polymerase [Handroanthus impetiginosus]